MMDWKLGRQIRTYSLFEYKAVANDYEVVSYMCQYFSKTEDQSWQAILQGVMEALRTTSVIITPGKQLLKLF